VLASDIVVLTPRALKNSTIVGQVGAFRLNEHPTRPSDVRLSSIRRFLGLEARVIVLCELPSSDHPDFTGLMYVGLSRARSHLVVIEPAKAIAASHAS
jgi:hypothetical protein